MPCRCTDAYPHDAAVRGRVRIPGPGAGCSGRDNRNNAENAPPSDHSHDNSPCSYPWQWTWTSPRDYHTGTGTQPCCNHHRVGKLPPGIYQDGCDNVLHWGSCPVLQGSEISGCDYAHPAYTVYHLSPTGTRLPIATYDPARRYMTVISDPNSATGPFSLDTRNNVAREFVIMSRADAIINWALSAQTLAWRSPSARCCRNPSFP